MSSAVDRLRRLPTSTVVVGLGLACLGVFLIAVLGAMGVTGGKNTNVVAGATKNAGNQPTAGDQASGGSNQESSAGGTNAGPDAGNPGLSAEPGAAAGPGGTTGTAATGPGGHGAA